MCVACVWDHSGGFSGVVYGKSSRVLGDPWGSPWEVPGESLGNAWGRSPDSKILRKIFFHSV